MSLTNSGLLVRAFIDNRIEHYCTLQQEAHHTVGLGETPYHLIRKRCRYSSLEKFQDVFDTALDLMRTEPSDAAFSAVYRTSINADRKQLVTSFMAGLLGRLSSISVHNFVIRA